MKVEGEYTFEAARDLVWEGLQDPKILASVMPGCEKLEQVGDDRYEGALKIKVGPVQGAFRGKIALDDIDEPNGYTMKIDGRGAPGFVNATSRLRLVPAGDDGAYTRLLYDADAQVGGRIASVGQRLLDSSAKAIIGQSLDGLHANLKARAAAAEAGPSSAAGSDPPAVEVQPPSQGEFAANVAREVAKDLLPPRRRWALLVGGLVLAAVVLYLLMR